MIKIISLTMSLFAIVTLTNAQTFKIEDLAKKTWVSTTIKKEEPFNFKRETKVNYNIDNTCHTEIYHQNYILKSSYTRKDHSTFYLSNTPDRTFDESKLKNRTGKYIIKKYNESKDIAILRIISISDSEIVLEISEFIEPNAKKYEGPAFVGMPKDNSNVKVTTTAKGIVKQNLK